MNDQELLDFWTSGGDPAQLSDEDLARLHILLGQGGPGRMPLSPGPAGPADIGTLDPLKLGGQVLEIGAGLIPGGLLARTAASGLAGGLTSLLSEEDDPERGPLNAAIEFGAGGLADKLARAGLWLALKTGGSARGGIDTSRTIDAFLRERGRSRSLLPGSGPKVGNFSTARKTRLDVGRDLGATEASLPGSFPADAAYNAVDELLQKLHRTSDLPLSDMARVRHQLTRSIEEIVAARGGRQGVTQYGPRAGNPAGGPARPTSAPQLPPGSPPRTLPNTSLEGTALNPHELSQFRRQVRQTGHAPTESEPPIDLYPEGFQIESPHLTVREAGEIARHARRRANKPAEMRRQGVFVPESANLTAEARLALSDRLFELQDEAIRAAGGDPAKLQALRSRFGDLMTIEEANKGVRTGLSALGVRGGFGAGAGYSVARLLEMLGILPPGAGTTGSVIGGAFAPLALAPQALTWAGYTASDLARITPTASRTVGTAREAKKPVKRREPK